MDRAKACGVAAFRVPGRAGYGEAGDLEYASMLRYAGRVAKTFTSWNGRPRAGYVMGGANWYGAECTNAALLFAAVLRYGRYDPAVTGIAAEDLLEKTIAIIRYISLTHDSGPADCVRVQSRNRHCAGTKWGERGKGFFRQSQCGRSVFALGLAAWLLWDRLDEETRLLVQGVVEYFEELFCEDAPRNGTYYDTQCEENGWTSQGLAIGPFLFPEHPRAAVWEAGYRRWAANTAVLSADRRRDRSRYTVTTLHPDFTTENHAFVHPDYLNAALCLRGPIAILSMGTGRPVAEEILVHDEEIYDRVLKPWILADGGSLYPQGQDWWYAKLQEFLFSHALMAVLFDRPDAAAYELANLRTCLALQDPSGSLFPERWASYPVAPHDCEYVDDFEIFSAPSIVYAFMLHAHKAGPQARPAELGALLASQAGTYAYPSGGLAVHRRETSIATVSWRNHVTFSTLPADGYWAMTPTYVNYVGVVEAEPVRQTELNNHAVLDAASHAFVDFGDGLAMAATVERLGGKLSQDVAFVSLPTGDTVYVERFRALRDCAARMAWTGIIGVRNESEPSLGDVAKGHRVLRLEGGASRRYEGRFGGEDVVDSFVPVRFLAVDSCMAFLLHNSRGLRYVNIHDYPKWRGLEDTLVLNCAPGERRFTGGRSDEPFVAVSMPNRGIDDAERASGGFAVLEAEPADCVVALHGDHLVYASFAAAATAVTARGAAGRETRIFPGRTAIAGGRFAWQADVGRFTAGFLPARWILSGDCEGLVVEASGSRGGAVCNRSAAPRSFEVRSPGGTERRAVRLEPGRFAELG